jgi:hypothetical protein
MMISSEVHIVLALHNGLCTACDIRPRHAQGKTLIGLSSFPGPQLGGEDRRPFLRSEQRVSAQEVPRSSWS